MRTYTLTITGKMPLLMHGDNIQWADQMAAWTREHKKESTAGDDRSPAFRWLGALYHDGTSITIPSDNLMRCLMEGGAMVPTGGKGGKTFKAQTQSGMLVEGPHWPLLVDGKAINVAPLLALQHQSAFEAHERAAEKAGFSLFVKRAKVNNSKHIRVRPMFDRWAAVGAIHVWDDQITTDALRRIAREAGLYRGLGDWRPGGKTPGPYGVFTAELSE